MTFPQTLRMMRAAKNQTQAEVGSAVGVTRQTIMSLEQGRTAPSLSLARKLSAHLEFSIDSLS